MSRDVVFCGACESLFDSVLGICCTGGLGNGFAVLEGVGACLGTFAFFAGTGNGLDPTEVDLIG